MGSHNPTDHAAEWIGARVGGKYGLVRLLGAGAMGAVYEGVHIDLGKRVAVKVLRPELGESSEMVARFRREARAASAIESEYVAQIFDFGRDDAVGLYMIIEYLEGEDLEARLFREKRLEPKAAARIGWQVARGLAKAHATGVVHRDLKPANLFLARRDDGSTFVKILDFGISKFDAVGRVPGTGTEGDAEPTLTEFGTTLGTPQYMSPEQCEAQAELDGRTDVWSLCAVLYEALAGEPAVSDKGGCIATMRQVVSADIRPLASRAPWVPEVLARVVDAGLVRDRRARIPNATTLGAGLLRAYPEAGAREEGEAVLGGAAPRATRASSEPPPSSSAGERVEIFMRSGEIPVPVGRRKR